MVVDEVEAAKEEAAQIAELLQTTTTTTAFPPTEALIEQELMMAREGLAGVEGAEGRGQVEVEEGETQTTTTIATEHSSAMATKTQQHYNRTPSLVERASLVLA